MKYIKLICMLVMMATGVAITQAQTQANILSVPDLKVKAGSTARLPIALENIDEVVALQFDIEYPSGITNSTGGVTLSTRAKSSHTVSGRLMNPSTCRVVVISDKNKSVTGNAGDLVYLDLSIPSSLTDKDTCQVKLKNIVLSDINGNDLPVVTSIGKITVARMPDLAISELKVTADEINPGDKIRLDWAVSNIGELPTQAGWTEQISIVGVDGGSKYLATVSSTEILAPGQKVSRNAEVVIPEVPTVDGMAVFMVKIVPDAKSGEPASALINNEMTTDNAIFVNKRLYFNIVSDIQENHYHPNGLYGHVTRSGNRSESETFNISVNREDSRVTFPSSVTIPAGESSKYFQYYILNNSKLDNDSVQVVTLSGRDYDSVVRTLTVHDDELPLLSISLDRTEVSEGESFQITVNVERASKSDLEVKISSSNSSRFSLPGKIVIPAGKTSVSAEGKAVDNQDPQLDEIFRLRAYAPLHSSQFAEIKILDNDIPALRLEVTPPVFGEGNDSTEIKAVVTRLDNLDKRITVNLSDSRKGLLTYSSQVVLLPGEEKVEVPIKPVDNTIVDYSREVNMTARVYLSSNGVYAPATSPGYATTAVTLLDDDGKTLRIYPQYSVWAEGSTNYLYISRNTLSSEGAVTVTLTSDHDSRLEYDRTVTIPAGSVSARVAVNVVRNTIDGDDFEVMFTASTPEYNDGVCIVPVSDASIADADVTLKLISESVEAKSDFTVEAVVANNGFLTFPEGTEVKVYKGGHSLVASGKLSEPIEPGGKEVISFTLASSENVVSTEYYAVVNEDRKVEEMTYSNNRSKSIYLRTTPGFTTELTTDKKLYRPGETVHITGKASGNNAADAPVSIVIKGAGFNYSISTECDNEGNFTADWSPYAGLAGRFSLSSSHPNASNIEEQAAVELYGMRLNSRNGMKFDIEEDNEANFDIKIYNPGPTLTGIVAEVVTSPANCTVKLDNASIASLASGETATIPMRIVNATPSATEEYDSIYVRIYSAETPEVSTLHWMHCRYHKAQLRVSPSTLDLTLVKDKEREIQVDITNVGLRESGEVRWTARQWVSAVSPIASIQPGETVTATLTLKAPENPVLDVPYAQSLVSFNCENGNGASVKLGVTVVSDEDGSLLITASDDNTYNRPDHPHLSGANVTISHSYSGKVVYTGTTDANGQFKVESIPEGYYDIYVTADKHYAFSSKRTLMNPGVLNEIEAMLFKNPNNFVVDPGSDPDSGGGGSAEVVIEPTITVDDAVPALVVKLPSERPALNMIIPIQVTNFGSVGVGRTSMTFTVPEGLEMEIIDKPFLNLIAPNQTVTFSAVLRALDDDADPSAESFMYGATVHAQYLCGPYTKVIDVTAKRAWGPDCVSDLLNPDTLSEPGQPGSVNPSLPSGNRFSVDGTNNLVTLQLSRTTVMSCQRMEAYFSVDNRSASKIENVRFDLSILDSEGNHVEDNGKFSVQMTNVKGFVGDNEIGASWSLDSHTNGMATISLTPTLEAALNSPTLYGVGGAMYYTDPSTHETVKVNIVNIPLYVNPMANLNLSYFLQRDVYGDDLSTPYEVEPSIPSELSLLIANTGNGVAPSVTVVMPKPEVRNNQTSLPLDFKFVKASLNGSALTPNMNQDITTHFGNIKSGTTAFVQYWMESNYTGHFTDYDVVRTNFGSTDVSESVIGDIVVRELIHSLNIDNGSNLPMRGFLVNDVEDDYDLPDHIYFTDNSVEDLHSVADAKITSSSGAEYTLQISPSNAGWNYGSINDPTGGRRKLESVMCLTDGKTVDLQNFWQTDRTMPDGFTTIRENRLHFSDLFGNEPKSYKLTFTYVPDKELDVEAFGGLSDAPVETSKVDRVTVRFNKAVKAASFTSDALALTCQGNELDAEQLTISAISDREFVIELSGCNDSNGCYVLSVDTRKMLDSEGFIGKEVRFAEWIQYQGGKVKLEVAALPENGGTVSPQSDKYEYGKKLTLKAEPAEGYTFSHWERDGELLTQETEVSVIPVDSAAYVAYFEARKYFVEVLCDGGTLEGSGTGYYSSGETLEMKVKAQSGWSFDGWKINGIGHSVSKTLTLTVEDDTQIEASFTNRKADQTLNFPAGWSWFTTTLTDMAYSTPLGLFSNVADQVVKMTGESGELYPDSDQGFAGSNSYLSPSTSYKVLMNEPVVVGNYGRISLNNEIRMNLPKGWSWLGYVPAVEMDLAVAFSDFVPEENDVVKSQTDFAVYTNGEWKGSLTSLTPNGGYMYSSGDFKTFHYPNNHMGTVVSKTVDDISPSVIWKPDVHRYCDNATVIAIIDDGSNAVFESKYTVGAFAGDECRGIGKWIDGRVFLTVHGDSNDGYINFRVINNATGEIMSVTEGFNFEVGMVGTYKDPYVLHTGDVSGIDGIDSSNRMWIISPNPVRTVLHIVGDTGSVESVSVIGISGGVVIPSTDYDKAAGFDVSSLAGGHYILAIKTGRDIVYRRFVKID